MRDNIGWQVLKRGKNRCVTTLVGKCLVESDDGWLPRDLVIVIVIIIISMIVIMIIIIRVA